MWKGEIFRKKQRAHAFEWKAIWLLQRWRVQYKLSETFSFGFCFSWVRGNVSQMGKLLFCFWFGKKLSKNAILSWYGFFWNSCTVFPPTYDRFSWVLAEEPCIVYSLFGEKIERVCQQMPKALSEKRTVWSGNPLKLNYYIKRTLQFKNQHYQGDPKVFKLVSKFTNKTS